MQGDSIPASATNPIHDIGLCCHNNMVHFDLKEKQIKNELVIYNLHTVVLQGDPTKTILIFDGHFELLVEGNFQIFGHNTKI